MSFSGITYELSLGEFDRMPYERTRLIEQRFDRVIKLIQNNSVNAKKLATTENVSAATINRILKGLKQRGYIVRSVHDDKGWHYEINGYSSPKSDEGDHDSTI